MNEEYLWDKTGTDEEIESLENALAAFRYQKNAAPSLPVNVVPIKREKPYRSFQLAFSAAACLAIAVFSLIAWLQVSKVKPETGIETAGTTIKKQAEIQTPETSISEAATNDFDDKKSVSPKQTPDRKTIKIKYATATTKQQLNKIVRRNLKSPAPQSSKLTEEEKYAYEQLMLALSITGSKLKEVKDKVEGMEE